MATKIELLQSIALQAVALSGHPRLETDRVSLKELEEIDNALGSIKDYLDDEDPDLDAEPIVKGPTEHPHDYGYYEEN